MDQMQFKIVASENDRYTLCISTYIGGGHFEVLTDVESIEVTKGLKKVWVTFEVVLAFGNLEATTETVKSRLPHKQKKNIVSSMKKCFTHGLIIHKVIEELGTMVKTLRIETANNTMFTVFTVELDTDKMAENPKFYLMTINLNQIL